MRLAARSRAALVVSACALLGAAATTMRPSSPEQARFGPRPPVPRRSAPAVAERAVAPRRDPFAGGVDPAPPPVPRSAPAFRPLPPLPRAVPLLAPTGGHAAPGPAARVTAIVTGAHPSAIVETDGGSVLVTPGSRLRDEEVLEIDGDGVRLASGVLLPLRTPEPHAPLRSVR